MFRLDVGKLLYLMKISRPNICNSVTELSKHILMANKIHWDAMHRIIQYVLETENYRLVSTGSRKEKNVVHGYVDSNYSSDVDTRKSITGYVVLYNEKLVSWKSKSQQSVTLSSTEAENVAM